jgi:hypothetical protein
VLAMHADRWARYRSSMGRIPVEHGPGTGRAWAGYRSSMGPVPVEHGPGTGRAFVWSHLPAAFDLVSDTGYLAGIGPPTLTSLTSLTSLTTLTTLMTWGQVSDTGYLAGMETLRLAAAAPAAATPAGDGEWGGCWRWGRLQPEYLSRQPHSLVASTPSTTPSRSDPP